MQPDHRRLLYDWRADPLPGPGRTSDADTNGDADSIADAVCANSSAYRYQYFDANNDGDVHIYTQGYANSFVPGSRINL